MAKNKITFYDLSHDEYLKVVSSISPFSKGVDCQEYLEIQVMEVRGNPPIYEEVTVEMKLDGPTIGARKYRSNCIRALNGLQELIELK